jgi:hypothetical protein
MIDRLMQLPPREKAGLTLALVLVALYVTDATVAKPLIRKTRQLDAEIRVERETLNRNRRTLSYLDSAEQQYAAVKDLIGVAGNEQEVIEGFKNEIDEIALRNGMRLKAMRHLPPEPTKFLVTYVVEISDFEAETTALINFLNMLSEAPGLIRARQVVLSSQNTDSMVSGSMVITKVMTRASADEASHE